MILCKCRELFSYEVNDVGQYEDEESRDAQEDDQYVVACDFSFHVDSF